MSSRTGTMRTKIMIVMLALFARGLASCGSSAPLGGGQGPCVTGDAPAGGNLPCANGLVCSNFADPSKGDYGSINLCAAPCNSASDCTQGICILQCARPATSWSSPRPPSRGA